MSTGTCEVERSSAGDERCHLVFAGRGRRLCEGRPASGSSLPMNLYSSRGGGVDGAMQVFVRTQAGKTLSLDVCPSDPVDRVKAKIQARERVAAGQQRLVFAGRHLDDGRRTLADYGVDKGANLHLLLRLRGGAGGDAGTGRPPSAGVGRPGWSATTAVGVTITVVAVGAALNYFQVPAAAAAAGGLSDVNPALLVLWALAVAGVNLINAGVFLAGRACTGAARRVLSKVGAFAGRNVAVIGVAGASSAATGIIVSAADPVHCFIWYALFLVAMLLVAVAGSVNGGR